MSTKKNLTAERAYDQPSFDPVPSFRLTNTPNPAWKVREGLSDATGLGTAWALDGENGWKTWNLSETPPRNIYPLLTGAIVPRPIAFVSTLSGDGVPNLAPFSYFSMVAHNLPLLSLSFSLSPRRPKDSRENILATREFTVSIISEPFVEAANVTAVEAPAGVNEWEICGLTMTRSVDVKPPWVKESAVGLECELFYTYDIRPPGTDEVTHTLVLGLIKRVHVRKSVLTDHGTIDPAKLRAVSRLGGTTYARIGEGFDLGRPSWNAIEQCLPRSDRQK
ncbi:hypothetical protein F5I97DRAFT_1925092 [Phlebopus sp. FC_14]|nr:hypothetical protein F5I97DRAFT_1925092 [Phlebopus sp. FC_14]